ncbi:MAG: OmpH/Skp family outer membrane protein [Planctomycetota bacterium]|jgi:Skp family chaperone for outer membrane proteins
MTRGRSWLAVFLTALAVWTVSTTINHAQSPAASTGGKCVAVVDLVYVFNEFEQTKAFNKLIEQDSQKIKEEMTQKVQNLTTERNALEPYDPNSPDYAKRKKEYEKMEFEARVWQVMQQERQVQIRKRWLLRNYEAITAEAAKVAKAKGIQVVITKEDLRVGDIEKVDANALYNQILNRKVLYADPALDLTQEVLGNLNAAFELAGGINSLNLDK